MAFFINQTKMMMTKWEPGKKVEEAYGEANFAKNRIKERKDVLYQIYSHQ